MKTDLLGALFSHYINLLSPDNPFETTEANKAHDTYYKKYIDPYPDTAIDHEIDFAEVMSIHDENAFRVGFCAALELIFER